MSGAPRRAGPSSDDWSEIEALLAVPVRSRAAVVLPQIRQRRVAAVLVSSMAVSVAFGGMLASWWSLQPGCDAGAAGCATTPAVAASLMRSVPTGRVADAAAVRPDAGALPSVLEGRSVSEVSGPSKAAATIEPAPVGATPGPSTSASPTPPQASLVPPGEDESGGASATAVMPPHADRLRRATTRRRRNASR